MLIISKELHDRSLRASLHLIAATLVCNLEVYAVAGLGIDATHLPSACVANAAFRLAHSNRFLIERHCVTDQTGDLELFGGEDFKVGVETHEQVVICILVKYTSKGLLVHGRGEAIGQDHMATS